MDYDLKDVLMNQEILPLRMGVFDFYNLQDPGDGSVQIFYEKDEYGYCSITIYNDNKTGVPDDINDERMKNELENCIEAIYAFQETGFYKNVELLLNEPCSIETNGPHIFQSAFLKFQQTLEDGSFEDPQLNFIFLKSDCGYYHKIRFTLYNENLEKSLDEMLILLMMWLKFISDLELKIA